MKTGTKIGIGIATVSALCGGGYYGYTRFIKNKPVVNKQDSLKPLPPVKTATSKTEVVFDRDYEIITISMDTTHPRLKDESDFDWFMNTATELDYTQTEAYAIYDWAKDNNYIGSGLVIV